MKNVVVVGAGAAGAAAAYKLAEDGLKVTVLERDTRVGGRIRSEELSGIKFEGGAQFLTGFYSNTLGFIDRLGLRSELFEISRSIGIALDGRIVSLLSPTAVLGSEFLSWRSKAGLVSEGLRILPHWHELDFHDMGKAAALDTGSVEDSLLSRQRGELLDHMIAPALDGFLYYSAASTSMGFLSILLKAGSQLNHMYALRGGLIRIVDSLLDHKNITILTGVSVESVVRQPRSRYAVISSQGGVSETLMADGVVIATTATQASSIVDAPSDAQSELLSHVTYSSTVSVVSRVNHRIDSPTYACMIPGSTESPLGMVNILSNRDGNAVPVDSDLISLYASGRMGRDLCARSDEDVSAMLHEAAAAASRVLDVNMGDSAQVFRWQEALPQFDVGYLKRLATFGPRIHDRGLVFAGDYLGGPFIEGAVSSGMEAAGRLSRELSGGLR